MAIFQTNILKFKENNINQKKDKKNLNKTNNFNSYLAGLFESDFILICKSVNINKIISHLLLKKKNNNIDEFNKLPTPLDEILIGLLLADLNAS
jgi:hypothetical protein